MSELEAKVSAAFAIELARSLSLESLVSVAGYDVVRQTWMLGCLEGRRMLAQEQLADMETPHAQH